MTAGFQFGRRYGGTGWRSNPFREGLPVKDDMVDRGFTFCRMLYTSVRSEAMGHGWNTDYPLSDENFMTRFEQLTTVQISRWDDGLPGHAVVRPMDDTLFECPFLFASDVGTVGLSTEEANRLRDYLLKGGFLWVDDFWGDRAWDHWVREIQFVLPEFEIVDLPMDHQLLHALYLVPEIPQVPSIQYWNQSGRRSTSERGRESVPWAAIPAIESAMACCSARTRSRSRCASIFGER